MIVNSTLQVFANELSDKEWRRLLSKLTFFDAEGREITCWRRNRLSVTLPRGVWNLLPSDIEYDDRRVCPAFPALKMDDSFKLDRQSADRSFEGQEDAVQAMLDNEQGFVIRPPGTGKTQIALAFIARAKTRTLVLVHTEDILQQWVKYARAAIPDIEIGVIQGSQFEVGHLTIAMVQTIKDFTQDETLWRKFGAIIVDEGHHAAARTWETILNTCPAKYRFGLTATKRRADRMEPLMQFLIGPVIHEQKFQSKVPVRVVPVKTKFYYPYRGPFDWQRLLNALVKDDVRNGEIARVAERQIDKGHSVLILSRRIEHLKNIAARMTNHGDKTKILTGRVSKKLREEMIERFRAGKVTCVLATQLADEALDIPRLDRVILTHPGKAEGRIIQQVGRAIREFPDKHDAIVFDIVDERVSVLRNQWGQRKRAYKSMKIPIQKVRDADAEKKPGRSVRDFIPQRSRRSSVSG